MAALSAILLTACGAPRVIATYSVHGRSTVTFAEGVAAPPDYILPLESPPWFDVSNGQDFSWLLYRPLYWFGKSGRPQYNPTLSIGSRPRWSDDNRTVTISVKPWRWSDGHWVTARDVIFWMNLLSAAVSPAATGVGSSSAPGPGWGAFVAGGFPQNVVRYETMGNRAVVFHLNASYDPTWFLYNELSQIYPLPQHSWDRLKAAGPVANYDLSAQRRQEVTPETSPPTYEPMNPGTATRGALGVAQFLNGESENTATYTDNPLWHVVDGPFELASYSKSGFVKMVPNANYSGSDGARLGAFDEIPFTNEQEELHSLLAGHLTLGYIPPGKVTQEAGVRARGYRLSPWYDFGISFLSYNFTNPTTEGIIKQLYFRQSLQSLVDQPAYIKRFLGGYAIATNGPIPAYPKGSPVRTKPQAGRSVYPYSPRKAVALLEEHGWTVVPGGTTTCTNPGAARDQCGTGIAAGARLSFQVVFPGFPTAFAQALQVLKSTAESVAGIQLGIGPAMEPLLPFVDPTCSTTNPCAYWDLGAATTGWIYSPDYFPTGEDLFATGAGANIGGYSDLEANRLIQATITSPTAASEATAMDRYETYVAKQLPVVWLPEPAYQLEAYKSSLRGLLPLGAYLEIYPEDLRTAPSQ